MKKSIPVLMKELESINVNVVIVNQEIYNEFLKTRLSPDAPNIDQYYKDLKKIRKELNINPADYCLVPSKITKK